jgi:hypothetical protein
MTKWTEEQVNKILGNESQGGHLVDIFSKDFYINVTLDSKAENSPIGWISSRWRYTHHIFTLQDFEECEDEDSIVDTFNDAIEYEVREML